MAFYYVKAGGAATGDGGRELVARTGSWTANTADYYDTLTDAISNSTTAPTVGDLVLWSDESSDVITGSVTVELPDGVSLYTVDNDAVDVVSKAINPQIDNLSGNLYTLRAAINSVYGHSIAGTNIVTGSSFYPNSSSRLTMRDSSYTTSNAFAAFSLGEATSTVTYVNCTLGNDLPNGSAAIRIAGGAIELLGCSMSYGTGNVYGFITHLGGTNVRFIGSDFSSLNASADLITFNASANNSQACAEFFQCTLPESWSVGPFSTVNQEMRVLACDSAYQDYQETRAGVIDFVTDVYYTSHDTLDDGLTKGSFEYETNADTTRAMLLRYGGPNYTKRMSAINTEAVTKTKVRVRFCAASGDTLNDADVCFLVLSPIPGANYRKNVVEHWRSELDSGTALATETGAWTGAGLGTQYYLDIDMGSPGNGRVSVIPGVCKPNVTVYFSWQLEFVA